MTSGRSGGVDRDLYISEKMPSVSVKDVDQQKFTVALAAFLKK